MTWPEQDPFIIADIGSNHRNSLELAFKQIEAAKECGASAAKFQMYTHKELYGFDGNCGCELPKEWVPKLKERCDKVGIEFMCSAFSVEGFKYIDPFVNIHKIASSESNDKEILKTVDSFGKPYLVSAGGDSAFISDSGNRIGMNCVGAYPASAEDYDLSIPFKGLSDHTLDAVVATCAAALGYRIFEKHFDCDWYRIFEYEAETPDTCVSMSPEGMITYVRKILRAKAIVKPKEHPRPCEKEMVEKHKRRETPYGFFRLK